MYSIIKNLIVSLSQILSFNIGVELGQIIVLVIVFPLLTIVRGKFFDIISRISNWGLIIAGGILLIYQLSNFFIVDKHHYNDLDKKQIDIEGHHHNHKDETPKHSHNNGDNHHSDGNHHHGD